MYNQYLVLGDALPGREDEYADWYVWVHVWDVMRPRDAAIATQCFRRADVEIPFGGPARYGHRFMAAYENSDPVAMTGSQGGAIPPDMVISSAADHSAGSGGGYYDTVAQHNKTPGRWPDADVIVEWIERPNPTADDMQAYVDTRFAAMMKQPKIVSGWLGKASDFQIFDQPRPSYVAFYRTTDLDGLVHRWSEEGEVPFPSSWNVEDLSVSAFRQMSKRITRQEVLAPDPAAAARAERARMAVKPMVS